MTLEEELIKQGFEPHGPYALSEISTGLKFLLEGNQKGIGLKEVRILRGKDIRKDMGDYPNLWMVYTLNEPKLLTQKPEPIKY